MNPKKILEGDLLYHPVHGLCRMERMIQQNQSGKKVPCYSVAPKITNKMRVRFIISVNDIESSGFHGLISTKEANDILDYLKAGDTRTVQTKQTWALAQSILTFAADKLGTKDQRKRKMLEYSVKGLVGELACALKTSLKEASAKVQKSLGQISKMNLLVRTALANAADD